MKGFKKLAASLLSAALVLNAALVLPVSTVSAQITEECTTTLSDAIENSFFNFDSQIDISFLDIRVDDFKDVNDTLNEVLTRPEMFFVSLSKITCSAGYDSEGNYILTKINVAYSNDKDTAQQYVSQLRNKADEIINNNITENMSDLEKAMKLHDYIVLNSSYDLTGTAENLNGGSSAYDILINGVGICQGYAQAYKYLLNKVGINCEIVTSAQLVHAWNLVEIDNQWYHVDVTWDDPVPDSAGKVGHAYFMLSDEAIQNVTQSRTSAHYGWDSKGITAQSTLYDNEFWSQVNTEIFISSGKWYYIDKDGIYSTYNTADHTTYTNNVIDDQKWMVWGSTNEYWSGKYTSLIVSNGIVYYNTPEMIYKMNMDGSEKQAVQYVNPYFTNGYVYGMVIEDNILYAVIKQSPKDEGTLYKITELQLDNYSYMQTVLSSIADLQDGESQTFDMAQQQTTVLPAQAIDMIKGRNVQIMFDFDEYNWQINGQNVTSQQPQDINLEINTNEGKIPQSLIDSTAAGNTYYEIDLTHSGQFGLTATVGYYVGKENAGKKVTLYYYNQASASMDIVSETIIDENGYIAVDLNHASTYLAVITDETQTNEIVCGDIDDNGVIDMSDLTLLSQYLLGDIKLTEKAVKAADVTFDGLVSLSDLSTFKQYVMMDIKEFIRK